MKRLMLTILLALMLLITTGCTTRGAIMDSLDQSFSAACTQFIAGFGQALGSQDAAALRALFSAEACAANPPDAAITELLEYTAGRQVRTEWDGVSGGVGSSRRHGRTTECHAYCRFSLFVDNEPHLVSVSLVSLDEENPDRVGASVVTIDTDYAECAPVQPVSAPFGLNLHLLHGKDYQTRRIEGWPRIWTDVERVITLEQLCALLAENPSAAAMEDAFGPPNADQIWQMADEDGEPRFVRFNTALDGKLLDVCIVSETDWLYMLWKDELLPIPTPSNE